jgi:outer membrane lipase/esterase
MKRCVAAAVLAVLVPVAAARAGDPYSSISVFGDSLSDRGRIPGLIEAQNPAFPLRFPVSPPYFNARFSNGPTYAERLPGLLGLNAAPGRNLAVGGAETDNGNIANPLLAPGGVTLPGIRDQIDSYAGSGGRFGARDLVVLYGGANDYFAWLGGTPSPAGVQAEVTRVVGNIDTDIRELAAAGAKTILVPNVPDLGSTPAYHGTPGQGLASALSAGHAEALNREMGALGRELGVQIVVADFATGLKTVLADPARFGFANVTQACVTSGTALPPYVTPGSVCSDPEGRLFWDSVHPTALGHQLLAEYAADTLMAPTTIGAQAGLALLASDNFLRRVGDAVGGGEEAGGPMLAGTPAPSDRPVDGFLTLQRAFGSQGFDRGATGFDYGVTSITGGVTVRPADRVTLGVVAAYDTGDADLDRGWGTVDYSSVRIGAVAGYDDGALFGNAGVAYGFDSYELERRTYVPQLRAEADPDGNSLSVFGRAGYRFAVDAVTFGPVLGLRYSRVEIDRYSESGAPGLDMTVEGQTAEALIGSAGIAAAARLQAGDAEVTPHLELSVEGDLLGGGRSVDTTLVTVPDVRRVQDVEASGGAYGRLAGGVAVRLIPAVTAQIGGETTFGRDGGDDYAVTGRLAVRF